jgi:hypothetical protein
MSGQLPAALAHDRPLLCGEIRRQYVVFTEIQATLKLRAAMSWSSIVTIDSQPGACGCGRTVHEQAIAALVRR